MYILSLILYPFAKITVFNSKRTKFYELDRMLNENQDEIVECQKDYVLKEETQCYSVKYDEFYKILPKLVKIIFGSETSRTYRKML